MNIKKRILSAIVAVSACVSMLAVSVIAAPAGYSDYGVSDTKTVAEVAGNSVALTDTNSGTSVDIPKSALPAGVTEVTFASKPISKNSTVHQAASSAAAAKGFSNVTVFDLKLLDQNSTAITQLNGKVAVTLKVEGDVNTVLYYNDATNSVENLGGTVKNGFITFETNHFSYYMLAKTASTTAPSLPGGNNNNANVTTPSTGDNSTTTIVLFSVMALIALGTTVVAVKAKKAK